MTLGIRKIIDTRIPYDPAYTTLVGTAVYVFSYYEWTMIYLIQRFKPGFVAQYCRGAVMTSGNVKKELKAVVDSADTDYTVVSEEELRGCLNEFARLIDKRNALIHAHPMTDHDEPKFLTTKLGLIDGCPT